MEEEKMEELRNAGGEECFGGMSETDKTFFLTWEQRPLPNKRHSYR